MMYKVSVEMKAVSGSDEHGFQLDRNFVWTLHSERKLREFIEAAENGDLGDIRFTVEDDNHSTSFDLQPTGEYANNGGYPQAMYKAVGI